jgi:hypothetical protein
MRVSGLSTAAWPTARGVTNLIPICLAVAEGRIGSTRRSIFAPIDEVYRWQL